MAYFLVCQGNAVNFSNSTHYLAADKKAALPFPSLSWGLILLGRLSITHLHSHNSISPLFALKYETIFASALSSEDPKSFEINGIPKIDFS